MIFEILSSANLSDGDVARINELLRELSPKAKTRTREDISEVLENDFVFVARESEQGSIVSMVTLVIVTRLIAPKTLIEDVVTAASYRGRGYGTKLMEMAIQTARELKINIVDLTSSNTEERAAAHRRYKALGFEARDSTLYRLRL